jgi:3-oxoacyl-[acyl-carrier protein] reductase
MLLANKNAVIYGGGGAIGGASARAFAREGARVCLAGRTEQELDTVANDIVSAGGSADMALIDALDEQAVTRHADTVAAEASSVDIAVNAVGILHVQGTPFLKLSLDEYAHPVVAYTRTNFITAKAVAPHTVEQGSGVILTLSTPGSRLPGPGSWRMAPPAPPSRRSPATWLASWVPAASASSASCPTRSPEAAAAGSHRETSSSRLPSAPASRCRTCWPRPRTERLLMRFPTLADVANTAAFLASDQASAISGAIANLTCGTIVD